MNESDDIEKRNDTAYFMFGRFQPPTKAHIQMIQTMSDMSNSADMYVFLSSTHNANKNPLNIFTKMSWLKKSNPPKNVRYINTTTKGCKTIFNIIDVLKSAGYTTLHLFVGSDRFEGFRTMFEKYPPKDITIKVEQFKGERSNKSMNSNMSSISGSKMRNAAKRNDFNTFKKGTNLSENDARILMNLVKKFNPSSKTVKRVKRVGNTQNNEYKKSYKSRR